MQALLSHRLAHSGGWGNACRVPRSCSIPQRGCGVPCTSPFQTHISALCTAGCSRHFGVLRQPPPSRVQFGGGSAGCTLSPALEARMLEAETHLRAVQEQQVPAFLAKGKEKEKKKRASEQRRWWCEQRWGMFSFHCMRVRPGRGLMSGCYGPWRMLRWLVKHLYLSKPLHAKNSLSLCTPPGSGISPISPEKYVFFFLLFRVRAARKDGGVQRWSAGKREMLGGNRTYSQPSSFHC